MRAIQYASRFLLAFFLLTVAVGCGAPGIFLRVFLQDGTSFRMVYYPAANAFATGAFGTEKLNRLITSQRQPIKAAAGL